jgi:hypothetical protein
VGLVRFLRATGLEVVEVNRPNLQHRRRFGKHDTAEAETAARALQADTATGEPKSTDGPRRWCAPCTWRGVRRSMHAHRLPTNCTHCSSPRQKYSGRSCAAFPRPGWSQPRRASVRAAFPKICGPRPSWR